MPTLIEDGTRVHLKHSSDPMYAAVQRIPGLEYKEVYGIVCSNEEWAARGLVLVCWDAGDANPWSPNDLEIV